MTVTTPTVRRTARRWLYWVAFAVAAILIVLVVMLMSGSNKPLGVPLSPKSPGPQGAMAIAEVLSQHGVEVVIVDSLDTATSAARTGTTVLLHDLDQLLDERQLQEVAELGDHTVLLSPAYAELDAIAPAVAPAGAVEGIVDADCMLGPVERAQQVTATGTGYRLIDDTAAAQLCLGSGDNVYSVIVLETGNHRVSIVGTTHALSNDGIDELGNAALLLGLLGDNDTLVWYVPGPADLFDVGSSPAALTPPWVTPVMALFILVTIAAAFWRGRRLGPLVIENLPVTVRSTETMEGRARLYQRSAARLRALDALRVGTIERLASRCRLPRTADVDDVTHAVAALTGRAPHSVRALLIDTHPNSDRELITLSDDLLELERAIETATRPQ